MNIKQWDESPKILVELPLRPIKAVPDKPEPPTLATIEERLHGAQAALETARAEESAIIAQAQAEEQRRAQLTERQAAASEALAGKNEEHARATLSGERTGALVQEIGELNAERSGLEGALRVLAEEEKATAARLEKVRATIAEAEYSQALEKFDAANMAAEGALRDFYESTLGPLTEAVNDARSEAQNAEKVYSREHGINWMQRTFDAPDHIRPCNSVRFILGALERWSKGEPL